MRGSCNTGASRITCGSEGETLSPQPAGPFDFAHGKLPALLESGEFFPGFLGWNKIRVCVFPDVE